MAPTGRAGPRSRFDELFDEAVPRVLGGTHVRDVVPQPGGRWPLTAALLPDQAQARALTALLDQILPLAGPGHFLTGRPGALHVTVRALERRREHVPADDPALARYLGAVGRTAARCGPVRLRATGVTLTSSGVLAALEPVDDGADRLRSVLADELGPDGWWEAELDRSIWYATLLHFAAPVARPEDLVAFVADRRRLDLGRLDCHRLSLVAFDHVVGTDGARSMRTRAVGTARLVGAAGPGPTGAADDG